MSYPAKTLCSICGERKRPGDPMTRGHIVPVALGGTDEAWNIRPEHRSCNGARGCQMTREDVAEAARRRVAWERSRGATVQDIRLQGHTVRLTGGKTARVELPRDLTEAEARRLADMVREIADAATARGQVIQLRPTTD